MITVENDAQPGGPGACPGVKVSINNHGDPGQPGAGDSVGVAAYVDDQNGRDRIWGSNFAVSVYGSGTTTAAASEVDVNNLGSEPSQPAGPRSFFGQWISGTSLTAHLGSAALLITGLAAKWWNGIFIDQAEVGIRMGGTMQNQLGIDMAGSRLRLGAQTVPPAPPPPGTVDFYAQNAAGGKMMLVIRWPSGTATTFTEP